MGRLVKSQAREMIWSQDFFISSIASVLFTSMIEKEIYHPKNEIEL